MMPMSWSLLLLILAVVIVFALAAYAWSLHRELARRRQAWLSERDRARDYCFESLDVIGRAVLADQVDLVEGCIRISVMLDILGQEFDPQGEFAIFDRIRQRTEHLHTHEARAQLTPGERLREDRDRLHIAADERDAVHRQLGELLAWIRQADETGTSSRDRRASS
ncbi:uncharacterized protein DUF2489 [Kushneria sinocarnis]|uniref:Uncharacterized protein DUF2489 n=2 Tax=Kushneria sinocarnis TaxID=595502 RepID=A0A420WY33_9GAMM|nr:uncharacterized protein DUF2489 [Kushneria sinocarnis]